jgi:hypothetical protein
VGHVVRTELATILHRGSIHGIRRRKNNDGTTMEGEEEDAIGDDLRRRINVVHADVSPDLRQARVTISVLSGGGDGGGERGGAGGERERRSNDAINRRRAYAWLVRNTKSIRHALSSRMSHMRGGSPELTFVQVDVGGAVDVMKLIEKVTSKDGYRRDDGGMSLDEMLRMGYEEGDDDAGWLDEDGEEADDDDDEEEDYDDENYDDENYDDENYDDENYNTEEEREKEDTDANEEGVEEEDDGWVDFDEEEVEEEEDVNDGVPE